jgi:hypothetical protein
MKKLHIKPMLVALAALVVLAAGTIFATNALASGITLHTNYGSSRAAYIETSSHVQRFVYPGDTAQSGTWTRIYTPAHECITYGWPGTGAIAKHCYAVGTWFTTQRSLWVTYSKT